MSHILVCIIELVYLQFSVSAMTYNNIIMKIIDYYIIYYTLQNLAMGTSNRDSVSLRINFLKTKFGINEYQDALWPLNEFKLSFLN